MKNTELRSANSVALTLKEFKQAYESWLLDGEIRQHSKAVLDARRMILEKFLWFCNGREIDTVNAFSIRQFLAYLSRGHQDDGGRWGNAKLSKNVKPATPVWYHGHLRTLFNWMVKEQVIDVSPMTNISAPIDRKDQIQPFTDEQVLSLLEAAKKCPHPLRETAICLLLLDTGLRASELINIKMGDVDLQTRSISVEGKGGKRRTVNFGAVAYRALWNYLREDDAIDRATDEPVFRADNGPNHGQALTRSGLLQIVYRLGAATGLTSVRCSPHTFRHTFAVSFLRNGGNQFTLMQMMGHTDVTMTTRYVQFAQADIAAQHRQFSPADKLKRKK